VRALAVLDRTKEPGAVGEPLYLEVVAALSEAMDTDAPPFAKAPRVIGGRYGLSSKEFRPAHVKAVFDELARFDRTDGGPTKRRFTVGIHDDVTNSIPRHVNGTDATSYTCNTGGPSNNGTFTPAANSLLVAIAYTGADLTDPTSVTGNGVTFTNVNETPNSPQDLFIYAADSGASPTSAAAVATGMGLASIGSDTGGSIRIPSSACGIVGLKPSLDEVPLDAWKAYLRWTVLDAAAPRLQHVILPRPAPVRISNTISEELAR
jgi:hypothetical protein